MRPKKGNWNMAREIASMFVLLGLKDEGYVKGLKKARKDLRIFAAGLTAIGASITAALGYAVKLAQDDAQTNAILANTLKNVGVAYDSVKEKIDAQVDAQRRATGITESDQINALNQLIMTTGDYQQSLKLLPLAMDLSKAKQMDLTQSALLLGRMVEGNINVLNGYGIAMDGVTTVGGALEVVQRAVGGAAVASRSFIDLLKSSVEELVSTMGEALRPQIVAIAEKMAGLVDNISKWVKENPELTKYIMDFAAAVGIAATAVGALTVAMLTLALAKLAVSWQIALVLLGIAALIAAGIFLYLNWDKVVLNWTAIMQGLRKAALIGLNPVLGLIFYLMELAGPFTQRWDTTRSLWANIWNYYKVIALQAVNSIRDIMENMINGVINGLNFLLAVLNKLGSLFGQKWDLKIDKVKLPRLTEKDLGIFDGRMNGGFGATGVWPDDTDSAVPAIPSSVYGNYGTLGNTLTFGDISIKIDGYNGDPEELARMVREELLKLQERNGGTTGVK